MPSATVEDYVKVIYTLQREAPAGEATVARIAALVGVTKGTVTAMVRKLRAAGLAKAERYGGVRLTPKGDRIALDVLRRHRLIEAFLVDVLKFDWSEVHDEAERLEHAMSPKLLDRLDAYLGHPARDPHGDPIPDANGKIRDEHAPPLADLQPGEQGVIARITDQDSTFLDFAARHGLRPGTLIQVLDRVSQAESITVKAPREGAVTMSLTAAQKIRIVADSG